MGGSWGADVGALRELAGRLAAGADVLRAALGQVDSLVGSSPWDGPDAERFRTGWSTTLVPALVATADLLDDAAGALVRDADQQQAASAADGGGDRAVAAGVAGSSAPDGAAGTDAPGAVGRARTPTPAEFRALDASDRAAWLGSASDARVVALYGRAVAQGVDPDSPGFVELAVARWARVAADDAGVDLGSGVSGASPDPRATESVAAYYDELHLDHPWMRWAGVAAVETEAAAERPWAAVRETFVDQAVMHEAYLSGGLPEMERLLEAGVVDDAAYRAWADVEAGRGGDARSLDDGNAALGWRALHQELADGRYEHGRTERVVDRTSPWDVDG